MIRVGGYTEETGNVLEGTLFQQIGRPMNISVRAKALQKSPPAPTGTAPEVGVIGAFDGTQKAELEIGAVSLSSVVLNQQSAALQEGQPNPKTGNVTPAAMAFGEVGLSDCDTIFSGTVQQGSLSLKFPGAGDGKPVLYDVTAN